MFNNQLLNRAQTMLSRDGLHQSEREAIIDLLLLGLYADNHISVVENDVVLQAIADFDWTSVATADIYINTATYRVREAAASPKTEQQFLMEIVLRLHSKEAQHTATTLLAKLLNADGTNEAENAFMRRVYDAFA